MRHIKNTKRQGIYEDHKGNRVTGPKMQTFPQLVCRKCEAINPMVYLAPAVVNGIGSCICLGCANKRQWLDSNGDLKEGITL